MVQRDWSGGLVQNSQLTLRTEAEHCSLSLSWCCKTDCNSQCKMSQ